MRIGILTGSGTYALPGIEADGEPELVETRFGSAPVTTGRFAGVDVLHISRHGPGHGCSRARSRIRRTSRR